MTTGQGDQGDEGLISQFSQKQFDFHLDLIRFKTECLSGSQFSLWDTLHPHCGGLTVPFFFLSDLNVS